MTLCITINIMLALAMLGVVMKCITPFVVILSVVVSSVTRLSSILLNVMAQ